MMLSMAKFTGAWRMMAGCLVVVAESKDGGCVVVFVVMARIWMLC